eukprot:8483536-Karenia_brevis.AAC.1
MLIDRSTNGRNHIIGVVLPNFFLVVANVYGWTNGHCDSDAAARTDDLIQAILEEFDALPPGPKVLLGDLNADVGDLPTLQGQVDCGKLFDLGQHAQLFGGQAFAPICFPPNSGTPSRRDYVFVTPDLIPFVHAFQVLDIDVPVHKHLSVHLQIPKTMPTKLVPNTTASIISHVHELAKAQLDIPDTQPIKAKQLQPYFDHMHTHVVQSFKDFDGQ